MNFISLKALVFEEQSCTHRLNIMQPSVKMVNRPMSIMADGSRQGAS